MDYKHIEILPLYPKQIDLRQRGTNTLVCGWGSVSQDDLYKDAIGDAQWSRNLHCMNVELLSQERCQHASLSRDFKRKLICAQASIKHQKTTSVTIYFVDKLMFFILSSGFFVMQLA